MGNTDILSIQLYTLRSLASSTACWTPSCKPATSTLRRFGSQLDDAQNVRTKLDGRGLKVSSATLA
jgi:hypothetical protein